MKLWRFGLTLALCLSLSACGSAPAAGPSSPGGEGGADTSRTGAPAGAPGSGGSRLSLDPDEEPAVVTCRIVDGAEDGDLLLAELGEGLHGGNGVYRLDTEDVPVTLDGGPAGPSALADGMTVEVAFDGMVMETFPARFGEVYGVTAWSIGRGEDPGGTCYDLCGLYLQVLDDLWNKDPALNEDISVAGLDLSRAPGGLSESEEAALAWRFGETHGVEVVAGTFDELKEQGYLSASSVSTPKPEDGEDSPLWYQWEDGCLFSITPNENHEGEVYSLPTLFFNAEKWRSPLGAYCFYDCSAVWPECGTWSGYSIGGEMIS